MQLLHLIEICSLEPAIVIMAAAALARILLAHKETTLSSLKQLDVLSVLARAIKTQQHSYTDAQVPTSCMRGGKLGVPGMLISSHGALWQLVTRSLL